MPAQRKDSHLSSTSSLSALQSSDHESASQSEFEFESNESDDDEPPTADPSPIHAPSQSTSSSSLRDAVISLSVILGAGGVATTLYCVLRRNNARAYQAATAFIGNTFSTFRNRFGGGHSYERMEPSTEMVEQRVNSGTFSV